MNTHHLALSRIARFARLVDEASAAGAFTEDVVNDMAVSMDLTPEDVRTLIDEASSAFEAYKDRIANADPDPAQDLLDELLAAHDGNEDSLIMVLDDLVHDAQIANASEVNNQGAHAQIAALLAAGILPETIRSMVMGDES